MFTYFSELLDYIIYSDTSILPISVLQYGPLLFFVFIFSFKNSFILYLVAICFLSLDFF